MSILKSKKVEHIAYLLGIISVTAFAMTLPFSKMLIGTLTPLQIGIYRSTLAAFLAVPITLMLGSKLPSKAQIIRLLLVSIGIVYGFPVLTAVGMSYVPVSHGGVVLAALPLATSIWGAVLSKNRLPMSFWGISFFGFLSVLALIVYKNQITEIYMGDIALLGAVVLASFGYAQGGLLAKEMKGWEVMCWTLILSLPILIPAAALVYDNNTLLQLNASHWGALLFLAFVNSLIGFFSWNKALALGGIAKISQLQLLQPFITYFYALLFMGEILDWLTLIVCGLVIGVVWIARLTLKVR